jgi:SNF2 family DNA or RNA helicase
MAQLEALKPGVRVTGLLPNQAVMIIDVQWHGASAVELVYKRPDGQPATQLLFRDDEADLHIEEASPTWRFSAQGETFRLAAEAYRIHLAHLFDPVLAVHTSLVEPLPHQITAVYGEMLTRQPLRFLLADDPGAGKTIMAGLLIKELIVRGDVKRCLICVPGSLAGQWQDELWFRFQLHFDILTRETYDNAVTGSAFEETDRAIIRMDQVARDEDLKAQLERTDWDLIIVDEAHKMSAHYWGGELEETQRYKLGKLLREITRHFLLMTATPHNGKEVEFQLFLALLDRDRFEGHYRPGVHEVDASDLMRRMIKEDLRRFDGRPLFPERRAYTVNYPLSPEEAELYNAVTEYVRNEFNRAEQLLNNQHRGTVGFALTILQRRLASSPAAIYHSLRRRRERLERRLAEARRYQRDGVDADEAADEADVRYYDPDYLADLEEDGPAEEVEALEDLIIDRATAARTAAELEAEIEILEGLETMAYELLQSGTDRKWEQLASIIQADAPTTVGGADAPNRVPMVDENGNRRKLIIFTEHRDTLNYLHRRIATLFGRTDLMVHIDGGVPRHTRREIEDRFRNDPHVTFLLATDAAAEGINLQRAHLMINYDLPWNPNRLEQRFGRIHRIGQTEVCHLWNLVSGNTREGAVYARLLTKLEAESKALQGKVFDILGQLFNRTPLRELLVNAIRYGDQPEVRAQLEQAVDDAVDQEHVRELLEANALASESMDTSEITRIREEMERYAARRLQPHYIQAFFTKAFDRLGGSMHQREPGRYRISYVPARIRNRAKALGTTVPVLETYDRVCFDKALMNVGGMPDADFLCPGHPLLDTVIDLVREEYEATLREGTVLIDPTDPGTEPRALFFLEQRIQDAGSGRDGTRRVISREVHFVEIDADGEIRRGGHAPYLDYRAPTEVEQEKLRPLLAPDWLSGEALETEVTSYAIEHLVPRHLQRIRARREARIEKTLEAVHARLTKEINYWDQRAAALRQRANKPGKHRPGLRVNAERAQQRADRLVSRLEERTAELERERKVSAAPPVIVGGALVVPVGLLLGEEAPRHLQHRKVTEAIAMQAVMEAESRLGYHPKDVSDENLGYDIESLDPADQRSGGGRLRFIEVKGRRAGAKTVTVTRNEILTGFNSPDQFILAIVEVDDGQARGPRYVREPFDQEPGFAVTSSDFDLGELLAHSTDPT